MLQLDRIARPFALVNVTPNFEPVILLVQNESENVRKPFRLLPCNLLFAS